MAITESTSRNGSEVQMAVMRVGQVWVGVNLDQVVHAMPIPDTLSILPQHAGALAGVIEYDTQIIPVVDLAKWVDVGSASDRTTSTPRIAILKSLHGNVGIHVDAVHGITKVLYSSIQRVEHSDSEDEIFDTVVKSEELGKLLCLLDVAKLCALACAWSANTTKEHAAQKEDETTAVVDNAVASAHPYAYAMFDLATTTLAVPASFVAEVIPMPQLLSFPSLAFTYLCEWRNRKVLVLNMHHLLVQEPSSEPYRFLALLTHENTTVALPIKAVRQIENVDRANIRTGDDLIQVCYNNQNDPLHILDVKDLFSRYPETQLSKMDSQQSIQLRNGDSAKRVTQLNREAYIAYEADGLCAIAVSSVEEVLPSSPSTKTGGLDSRAVINWRGKAVDTYDLRKNQPVLTATDGVVLIVRLESRHVAFIVNQVSALVAPGSAEIFHMKLGKQGLANVLTTSDGSVKTSYVVKEPALLIN